ncbi:MAG: spore germination protein GerPC [Bacillus sp. (in: firmicutes)]
MHTDINTYAGDVKRYLDDQSQRVSALEAELKALKKELEQLGARSPVTVERLEYKFDQLKIESLDGTLNIGLNPAKLEDLDDFFVNGQPHVQPGAPPYREDSFGSIISNIKAYIEKDLDDVISSIEREIGMQRNAQYAAFIKEDLLRQLPDRVEYYLKQFPFNPQHEQHGKYLSRMTEQIKTDVMQAVRTFLTNAANGQNGG